jgi:hypothetical protein
LPARVVTLCASIACAVLLAACAKEEARPAPSVPVVPAQTVVPAPAEEPQSAQEAADAAVVAADDAAAATSRAAAPARASGRPAGAKLREIHPLSPSRPDCLEMVSYCTGKPRRCTSAPLHIACGEEAEVAARKEWLRCVCP